MIPSPRSVVKSLIWTLRTLSLLLSLSAVLAEDTAEHSGSHRLPLGKGLLLYLLLLTVSDPSRHGWFVVPVYVL
jgi:hypothetical protein